MRTKIGLIGLLLLSLQGMAQMSNPSFEQTDSTGAIANWQLLQGKATRVTVEQFGIIPFTAFAGNFFTKLESDTDNAPVKAARFVQTFPLADTPASFYLHHLYLPENTNQTAGIQLLMTKWNGASRDTILYVIDSVPAVANGNQVPIQWNRFGTTLRNRYLLAQLPDTATLELTNNRSATGTQIRWYVDDLSFGKWPVGINEVQTKLVMEVYPNPASEQILVKLPQPSAALELRTLQGLQLTVPMETLTDGTCIINTQSLPNGLYVLYAPSDPNLRELICIQHP
jgi:hypothetical protein